MEKEELKEEFLVTNSFHKLLGKLQLSCALGMLVSPALKLFFSWKEVGKVTLFFFLIFLGIGLAGILLRFWLAKIFDKSWEKLNKP